MPEVLNYETGAPTEEQNKCRKRGLTAVQRKNAMDKAYREMLQRRKELGTDITYRDVPLYVIHEADGKVTDVRIKGVSICPLLTEEIMDEIQEVMNEQ